MIASEIKIIKIKIEDLCNEIEAKDYKNYDDDKNVEPKLLMYTYLSIYTHTHITHKHTHE
jgi:hypothetical protein